MGIYSMKQDSYSMKQDSYSMFNCAWNCFIFVQYTMSLYIELANSNNTCPSAGGRVCSVKRSLAFLSSLYSTADGIGCSKSSYHWIDPAIHTRCLWLPILLLALATPLSSASIPSWTAICGEIHTVYTHKHVYTCIV